MVKYPHSEHIIRGDIAIEVKLMDGYTPFFRKVYDATNETDIKNMISELKNKGVRFPRKVSDDWFY